jgi:hypothetical protein
MSSRWLEPRFASDGELEVAQLLARHFWRQTIDSAQAPEFFRAFELAAANRLATPIVAAQLDSTVGSPFLVTRLFGGFVPYLIRSIRPDRPIVDHSSEGDATSNLDWVETFQRYLGLPTFEAIMTTFSERFTFDHPTPADFVKTAESESGRDLTWFFDQIGKDGRSFDYAVDGVDGKRFSDGRYLTRIVVARHGDGVFSGSSHPRVGPYESGRGVEVAVEFGDGARRTEYWDGRDQRKVFMYDSAAPVERVSVDPNRTLAFDRNKTNNGWALMPRAAAARNRWALRWMTWIEDLLVGYSFFA